MMVHALAMWDRVRFAPPRDSGASVAASANGVGPDGTPPGHGGDIPGKGHGKGGANGGGTVTPPSGTTPPGATPPGATPPGQGGDNPGNGGGTPPTTPPGTTPPGQSGDNPGVGPDGTPPGQGGDNPGNGIGPDGTPPGQGGTPPGQGGNPGNGNQPVVTVADVVVAEDGTAWVTITLDQPSKHPIKIDYHTADGTAVAGADYQAMAGQVQIPAGELSVTIQVPILADATDEAHETFLLQLTKATGATIGDGQAVITITDDDAPVTPPALRAATDEDAGAFAIDLLDGVVDLNGDQPWVVNAGQLVRADGSALTYAVTGSTLTFDLNQLTDLPLGTSEQVTLTYQVTDGSGTADRTLTVTVEGRNDAPVAIAIQHETLENVPTINFAFQATDVDQGATLTYDVLTQPDLGRVVNRLDGTFDFVAGEDFRFLKKGEPLVVSFSYLARDEHGAASQPTTATITVIGTNTDPIVNADFFAGTEDTQLHLSPASLLANDVDEDGDPLMVDWVGNPQGGTVAFDASGQVVFTPAKDVNGPVTFDYRVNDGRGGLVTQTVTIMLEAVNDAPVAAAVGASVGEDGPAVTVAFAGSDVDAGAALSYTVLTQPGAGSVVNNGDGTFAFDSTGAFDHLKAGEQAQVSFTYRVTDEQGAFDDATATVTVTGINDAPVANLDRTATLRGSAKVILANDLLANDTDPEGDPLSLQEVFGATGGSVSYDPASGEILFTPEAGFIGTGTFRYRIADGQGGSAVGTVEVRVITTQGNGNPIAVDDTLLGTCGVDTLVARDGGDTLIGGGGSDTFIGGSGDDTIITNGDDTVDGGGGTDRVEVVGGYGAVIDMGASNVEIVVGGAGGDTVTGGAGNDVIYGGGGDDVLWGGDGDNYISGGGGSDTVGFGGGIGGYGFSFGGGGGGGGGGGWGWGSGGFGWGGGGGGWGWTITGGGGSTYVTGVEWISFPGIDVQFDADGRPCAFRIYEDVPVVIPKGLLLGNDSDPDGDTLYIASVQEALNASVGLTANGDVSFLGAQDFNGITTFTYTVSDGNGGYDDALVTVYVRPVNDAPVVAAPLVAATDEDSATPVAINLLTGASDVDGDTLLVTNFHQTGGRTAQFVRNGASFTLDPRQFTGLKQGEVETLTFDWTVSDGWTHTPHSLTITVDGINDAPVAKDDTLRVDQYRTLRVGYDVLIGNDVDVDGETLTMVTPIGTYATDLGGTAVFDGSTVLYTPKAGFWGADSVTYTIRDPQGVESTATIWLDVQPPSAPGDGWIWVNLTTGLARNQFGPIPFPDTAPDLTGTRFSDVLVGDANANTFAGMAGNDFLNGLAGIDTADYTASNAAVAVNLATGDGRGGHAEGDRVVNFENLIGSQYGDTLTGNLFANTLTGATGDDTLEGGAGADVLDGGSGNDTAAYTASAAGVVVSLSDGTALAGDAQGDSLVSIENLTGSAYADRLSGDDGANILKGLAGNDLLAGGGGDDLLEGGLGGDSMVGGDGIDTASYANAASFVEASLGYGGTRGEAAGDSFTGVENIRGSNWNDILRGDQGDNLLAGQGGNDTLEGGLGSDVLDGGTGTDQASYASAAEGVVVDLATGWTAGAAALGDTLVSIEDLGGSAYADTLTGNGGVNVLSGRDGDDLLDGGLGADSLDGGDGVDTATYAASASAVTINITTNDNRGGAAQGDTYSAIENVVGSRFNDSITGDGAANSLSGGDGDDRLEGLAGADTLDGGSGTDTAAWSGAQTGVTVNLTTNVHAGTDAEGDILVGIEHLLGSGFADTLIGDDGANLLSGAAGDDVLDGRAGADSLVGGTGADTADYRTSDAGVTVSLTTGVGSGGTAEGDRLSGIENLLGSAFTDTLTGDGGANTLDGGAGIDTASYQPSTAGVTVSLLTNTGSGGMAEGDVLASIENLTGSAYADRLTGDSGVNVLHGLGGDDGIEGGAAADTIDGGAGTDTATYRLSAAAVTVDLTAAVQAGGDAEGDVLSGIENLTGSVNDDSLSGDAGANVLEGGLGADVLEGRDGIDEATYANAQAGVAVDLAISAGLAGEAAGDRLANIENLTGSAFADSLAGDAGANRIAAGAGDDLLQGGAGADTLDGGSGTDTAAYDRSLAAVTVDLATNANHGGDAEGDVLTGVENLLGSSGADTLSGNAQANQLAGADGDDTLEGRGGADVIDGGAGTDTASYAGSGQAVTVNLSTGGASGGDAAGDQLANIENLTGSRFNDWLTGEAGTNTILAGAGNDTLRGLGGADVLSGGAGQDVALYDYSGAGVQVDLAAGTGRSGDAEGDVLGEIEDLIGSLYADSLAGNAGVNTLWGNSGDDVLEGRGGGDSFDGGGGSDTLSYSQSTAGVSVNLATRTASGGDAQGDSFVSMENLRGSEFADTLTGDSSANTIEGLGGNDLVDGGAAGDIIDGGDGTDRVTYAASTAAVRVDLALVGQFGGYAEGDQLTAIEDVTGSGYADTLRGNAGANALSAGSGDDLLEGRDGADTLDGGAGTDTATYAGSATGVHVDMLTNANSGGEAEGDVLANIENLIGSAAADFLGGTAGVNSLVGGLGDDVLKGAGGGDVLDGGLGSDTASYAGSATGVFIDLKLGTITRGDATGDRFVSIENLLGSDLADTLIGDDGVNVLSGAGGDDLIDGGLGADTIDGGAGYDTASYSDATAAMYVNLETGEGILTGGWGDVLIDIENIIGTQYDDTLIGNDGPNVLAGFAGNDFIEGRNGADTLYGGYGIDTVSYETSEAGVTVNLTTNVNTGGDAQGDLLSDFENMIGSGYGDRLTGNNLDNLMHGLGGDDTLDGGAGNDTLFGDAGADYLIGGSGTDWVTYYASGVAVTIDLAGVSSGGDAQGDRYSGIDRVTATVFDDVIFGDASATQLQGMEGNDTIEGGAGGDQIQGGSGNDTASYSRATGGVDARLSDGRGYGGDAYGDTLTGIENLTGSAYGDTLMGDNLVNTIAGGAGDDYLYGWGGDDTLLGQLGNDVIYGGDGADTLWGEVGNDQLFGGAGADTLWGEVGNDQLFGDSGNDTLWGDVGDDWLEGQAGADIIDGASGSDTVSYNSSQAAVYVSLETLAVSGGDATGDTLIGIEHAYGSGYGDTLIGDLGANSLSGSGGNDLLEGLAGADRLDGGGDFDTATYARSDAAIRIDLASGTGSGGHAEGDTLTGVEGVIGSDFDDALLGDAGTNRLLGGAGSDFLQGRGGADTLNGGDGVDTASYVDSSGGVTVNLATGTGLGADAQGDVLTAVENLIGTAYADTLTGEAGVNVIVAAAGVDLLAGLEGGDTLDGGSGIDTASYLASAQGVVVSLATGTGSAGDADGDVLMNIENLIGSQQADHLIGDAGDNRIEGRGGPDLIEGGAGNDIASYENSQAAVTVSLETGVMSGGDAQDDVLTGIENFYGSAFADTLIGDAGVNTLWGAAGDDLLEGLQGADRFDGGSGFDTATYVRSDAAVRVDLAAGTGLGGHAEGDSLVNVEKLVGSVYDDVLRGDGYTNHLLGGTGNDLIEGRGGADLIDGGDGNDTASYVSSTSGVSVNLTDGKGYAADAYGDVLTGIENLEGSSYGDVLVGDAGVNIIRGGTGNDDLAGRGGADTLDGGVGIDTANYLVSMEAVTVNLETGIHTGGDAQDDLFISIENVTGSNFNDLVIGDAGANALSGEGGDDTLEGLGGADVLTGGAGLDTADYRRSGTGVIINLTAGTGTGGDAAGDTLTGIERVLGSSFNDTLIGDGGANQLYGNAGNDQLEGRGAGDYLDGGDGNDTVYYGTAGSYVAVNLATGSGSRGEATGDTIVNVENIIGSGYGDTLTGDAGVNTIAGGAGYDLIEGGAGADVLDGGASTDDTAAYYGSSAGVTVSLATGSGQGGDAEGDILTGFENLAGSEFADQLEGDGADNALSGRDGDDLLEGLGGNDRLHGNDGNDTLDGGDGDDVLFGDGHVVRARLGGEGYYGGPHYIIGADSQPIGDGTVTWSRETTQMSQYNRLYPDPRAADYRTLEYHAVDFSEASEHSVTVTFDNDAYYGWWISWYWGIYDFYDRNLLVDSIWVDDRRIDVYNTGSGPRMEYNGTLSFALDIPVDTIVDAGADTLIGGAGNDTLYGEGGADLLTGGTGNDSLFGGDGDDQLSGDGGNDTLWGNAGNDTASGGDGMDTFYSSQGADTFIGGSSWDTVDYAASAAAVAVDLTGTGTGGDAEGDRWTEIERVVGSAYNDQIHGDLTNDTLDGGGGNDVLQGRGGADSLIGGAGVDTASYRDSAAGVTVDIQTNANSGGDAAGDVLAGIENLTGSAHADWLKGDAGVNTLAGAAGDDLLEGRGGADLLDGGDGNDTAAYTSSATGVAVSLATGAGSGGDAQGDTLAGIENLSGSAYADTLTGDGGVNTLAGQAGDDRLSGLGGADTLDGGLGTDIADYAASGAAVSVDLSVGQGWGGDAEGDVLVAVENLVGSALADRLTGDAGANSLEGGLGADVLAGGDGLDTAVYARSQAAVTIDLSAGTGSGGQAEGDILTGIENVIGSAYDDTFVSGADTATLNGGGGSDTVSYVMAAAGVTADLAGGRLIAVENVVGSAFADSLKGDAGANRLSGGEGDDTLEGRAGADVLSGGDGIDTAVYTSSSAGVTVNLATGAGSGGEAQGDQLSGIENLIGSALADTLIGDAGANRLEGGAGDDQFRTGGGGDVIDGGTGFDTLVAGGAYADSIFVRTATGWQVTDLAQGGTATLTGIEAVRFSDRTIYLDGRNNLPILVADNGGSTPEDTPIVITEAELLGNDSDFDGDEFVLWSVGGAQNGTVALDGFNNVTFTPGANYHGPASFTYTVRDSQGGYATQVVTLDITSVNDAPEAAGERTRAWSTGPQTFTAAQLKANDHDVDGDAFTITSVDNAAGGVASLNPDGSVTFTPISGFGGIGGFDYTLSDPSGATATARMSIYSPGAGGGGFGTIIGGVSGDLLIGADDATYQAASATFDAGDRLQTTIGAGGNRQKFIYSSWIKGAPTDGVLWADSYSASYNQYSDLYFSGGTAYVRLGNGFLAAFAGARALMTQEWNHVFLKLDTMASDPADRLQLVVNGQSLASAQPISQNATLPYVNQAGLVRYTQFTGEMAEMHLLDGQNARVSDFGTLAQDGTWVAKAYSGSHGATGVYLDFSDPINPGADRSGNGFQMAEIGNVEVGGGFWGANGNDTLLGRDGGDTLIGNAGDDVLDGNAGADTLIGGAGFDTYRFGRGYGADTVDNRGHASDGDAVAFDATVDRRQLWLQRAGDDLEISIIGTGDAITIDHWYADAANHVSRLSLGDGSYLLDSDVDALVSAMAAMIPPPMGQTQLTAAEIAQLDPVLAAGWRHD